MTGNGYTAILERRNGVTVGYVRQTRPSRTFKAAVHADFLFSEFIEQGQYVRELRRLRPKIRARGGVSVVVDGGANDGLFGVFAAAMLDPVTLVGFEPIDANVSQCEANWTKIRHTLHPVALGDRHGTARFHLVSLTGSTLYPDEAAHAKPGPLQTVAVEVIPLDSLHLGRVDLIKLDVEGAEEDALRGATETVHRCRPFILCSYEHHVNNRERLKQFALDQGYTVRDDEQRRLLTFEP